MALQRQHPPHCVGRGGRATRCSASSARQGKDFGSHQLCGCSFLRSLVRCVSVRRHRRIRRVPCCVPRAAERARWPGAAPRDESLSPAQPVTLATCGGVCRFVEAWAALRAKTYVIRGAARWVRGRVCGRRAGVGEASAPRAEARWERTDRAERRDRQQERPDSDSRLRSREPSEQVCTSTPHAHGGG